MYGCGEEEERMKRKVRTKKKGVPIKTTFIDCTNKEGSIYTTWITPPWDLLIKRFVHHHSMRVHTIMREMHLLLYLSSRGCLFYLMGESFQFDASQPCCCYGTYTIAFWQMLKLVCMWNNRQMINNPIRWNDSQRKVVHCHAPTFSFTLLGNTSKQTADQKQQGFSSYFFIYSIFMVMSRKATLSAILLITYLEW